MSQDKRTIGYLCPKCRSSVVVEKDLFSLTAAPVSIPCPCGGSRLTVEYVGSRFRLNAPCVACGQNHVVSCKEEDFRALRGMAFSCKKTGLDCCYVGEEGPVYAALRRLEEAADRLEEAPEEGQFLNAFAMEEVLSELKELAQAGNISCSCGGKKWRLRVGYAAVDLICGDCGGNLRIPAATASDIDDLCCRTALVIYGRE